MVDLPEMESDGFVTSRCSALSSHVVAPPTHLDTFRVSQNVFPLLSRPLLSHVSGKVLLQCPCWVNHLPPYRAQLRPLFFQEATSFYPRGTACWMAVAQNLLVPGIGPIPMLFPPLPLALGRLSDIWCALYLLNKMNKGLSVIQQNSRLKCPNYKASVFLLMN